MSMASFDIDGYSDVADSGDGKQSKFNSAQFKLMRLDGLWNDCHRHSRLGELIKWNSDLDRVWCELACHASDAQKERFDDLNKQIADNNAKFFLLMEKELLLRKIEDKAGLGAAYYDPDDEMM